MVGSRLRRLALASGRLLWGVHGREKAAEFGRQELDATCFTTKPRRHRFRDVFCGFVYWW